MSAKNNLFQGILRQKLFFSLQIPDKKLELWTHKKGKQSLLSWSLSLRKWPCNFDKISCQLPDKKKTIKGFYSLCNFSWLDQHLFNRMHVRTHIIGKVICLFENETRVSGISLICQVLNLSEWTLKRFSFIICRSCFYIYYLNWFDEGSNITEKLFVH